MSINKNLYNYYVVIDGRQRPISKKVYEKNRFKTLKGIKYIKKPV